jgi:predicted SprT family Zn-dependent metalloprotease
MEARAARLEQQRRQDEVLKLVGERVLWEMSQHGLVERGWRFRYDESRRYFGRCWHGKKEISLSKRLVLMNDWAHTKETILHEIAHALCGPGENHGPGWRAMAVRVGAKPVRCFGPEVKVPPKVMKFTLNDTEGR